MRDFEDVLMLHSRFDFPRSEFAECPTPELYEFRRRFLHEELDEYHLEFSRNNLVGVVDGLLDFVYVCLGTALFIGTPRHGRQGRWPAFSTARQILVEQGVLDEDSSTPHLLSEAVHLYTMGAMRARVHLYELAYRAACEVNSGITSLMLVQLKVAVDEAYKAAAMMNIPWERCWRHVSDANLRKKPGPVEKRGGIKWDLSKPCGWLAPEAKIATELMLEGWKMPSHLSVNPASGKIEVDR